MKIGVQSFVLKQSASIYLAICCFTIFVHFIVDNDINLETWCEKDVLLQTWWRQKNPLKAIETRIGLDALDIDKSIKSGVSSKNLEFHAPYSLRLINPS